VAVAVAVAAAPGPRSFSPNYFAKIFSEP
jgi:hypothetical protein